MRKAQFVVLLIYLQTFNHKTVHSLVRPISFLCFSLLSLMVEVVMMDVDDVAMAMDVADDTMAVWVWSVSASASAYNASASVNPPPASASVNPPPASASASASAPC